MSVGTDIPDTGTAEEAFKLVLHWHRTSAQHFGRPLADECLAEFTAKNKEAFLRTWTAEKWKASKEALKRVAEFHCMTAVGLSKLIQPEAKTVSLTAYQTAGKFVRQFCPPSRVTVEDNYFAAVPEQVRGDWCTWP